MAFCTSCGSQISDDAVTCPNCGANTSTPFAPQRPAPAATFTPPSYVSGDRTVKVVLIVVGAVLVLGLAAIALTFSLARRFHVTENTVELPGIVVKTDKGDVNDMLDEVGVPSYPGATGGGKQNIVKAGGKVVANVELTTPDPVSKVLEFYRAEFPDAKVVVSRNEQAVLNIDDHKGTLNVVASRSGDQTRIHITRVSRD